MLPVYNRTVPLQEAHAEAHPTAPEPATAEVAPVADKEGLAAEVTPAAVDSTAAAGEPIAEAMVALQEVMEPAPVPEPVLEGALLPGPHISEALLSYDNDAGSAQLFMVQSVYFAVVASAITG